MSSRRPWRLAGALALALTLTATGCGSGDASDKADKSATRSFKADNGDITIPTDPKRVVATGYAVPVLIEADAALVGISTWPRGIPMMTDEDRATYEKLEKVAGATAAETNYEAIAAVKPDLIVIGVPAPVLADVDIKRLESIAPVVAIGPTRPDAWREQSRQQSDAAGRLDNFEDTKKAYESKVQQISDKYKDVLKDLKFGHLGAYGEVGSGEFHREFAGSWGTNVAVDLGVQYYGEVKKKGGGSADVSEYSSIEELPASFAEADAITYTVQADGTPADAVKYVLDNELWKNLPAVKAGRAFPVPYTEAVTYTSALKTLDALDKALAPLLES
ncbi:ABC transporter substrate-binding protein [Actinocorallia populi]|uniref:ABC transporter substrate-binding protein n=1 Tax=Actinocorallia populi TaxID=2079200 RepID=UPI000D08F1A3|nr:ABC transporter substrate-binding protein [Actinocorallia populi]